MALTNANWIAAISEKLDFTKNKSTETHSSRLQNLSSTLQTGEKCRIAASARLVSGVTVQGNKRFTERQHIIGHIS